MKTFFSSLNYQDSNFESRSVLHTLQSNSLLL